MKYDSALEIDKNNLDEEAIQAPQLFDEFSRRLGEAKPRVDNLKDALKVVMADVNLDIRGWPLERINKFFKLQLPKVTEDVYKNLVFIHPKVIQLHEEIAQARRDAGIYEGAKDSMDKKTFMLCLLKDLHGQGYFAKIEGGPAFRKISIDLAIEEMKSMIAARIDREGITYKTTEEIEEQQDETQPKLDNVDEARAKLAEEIARRQSQAIVPKAKTLKSNTRIKAN
jgi:hypothetical protein